jgi:fructosamine-3-kinase
VSDPVVAAAAGEALGAAVVSAEPVAGGDINRALRLRLDDGRTLFVKHRADAEPGMYAAEADGLAWLAAAEGAVRLPEVAAVGDGDGEGARFLALEWIERGPPAADFDERLGRGLAALHGSGAPVFGLDRDNWIGSLPQHNQPSLAWAAFYGERRLAPLAREAVARRLLPTGTGARVERLIGRLEDLCGPPEPPARLHGDLWGGNAMADADGHPVLVDPAVYGGHREVDLAMMRLFGGFSARCLDAYREASPLAPGHEDRVDLYQLYPLLVHVLLFGGAYAGRLERALGRYVAR